MGLPSGRKWAVANIDLSTPSGFQEVNGVISPYKYECSFCSWGNTDMYNPNAQNSFINVYNWGSVNANEPYYEGQPYGSTPGALLTEDIGLAFDAARRNLGAPCRMPTTEEFEELFNNCDFIDANGNIVTASTSVSGTDADKRIVMNGIVGLRLRSRINGKIVFFPASGYGSGTTWNHYGTDGQYWSKTWVSERNAHGMCLRPDGVYPDYTGIRYFGFAIRPVI